MTFVFIPGIAMPATAFARIDGLLRAARFDVHVVAVPGYGAAPAEDGSVRSRTDAARRVLRRVREPATLVGAGAGFASAIDLAREEPERVAAIVGLGGSAGPLDEDRPIFRMLAKAFDDARRPRGMMVEQMLSADFVSHDPIASIEVGEWVDASAPANIANEYERFGRTHLRFEDLSLLKAPVLAIHGGLDLLVPPSYVRAMVSHAPNVTCHAIPDAGHAVHVERPARCAAVLAELADALPRRAAVSGPARL